MSTVTLLNEIEAAVFDILAAASIDHTAAGYDAAAAVADLQNYPSPLSLRPNEQLMMACIYGRSFNGRCQNPLTDGWGDYTATTAEAVAIRDSWRFCESRATRVIYVADKPTENKGWFIGSGGSRGSTRDENTSTCAQPVTSEDLDAAYRGYLSGTVLDWNVLALAQRFIIRLSKFEYNTMYARERDHEDDVASEFLFVALKLICERRCSGDSLAAYLSNAFRRFAIKRFNKAKAEAALTESYSGTGVEDEEGNFTNPAIDDYSVALSDCGLPTDATPFSLDHLSHKHRLVAEGLAAGLSQKGIADKLDMSRHQVARSIGQLRKKLIKSAGMGQA